MIYFMLKFELIIACNYGISEICKLHYQLFSSRHSQKVHWLAIGERDIFIISANSYLLIRKKTSHRKIGDY